MLQPTIQKLFPNTDPICYTLLTGILFFGYMIGTFFVGMLTKNYGRRNSTIYILYAFSFLAFAVILFENIYYIIVCRFFIGICMGIIGAQFISNLAEFLPNEGKEIIILSMFIFFRIGIIYFLLSFKFVISNNIENNDQLLNWRCVFLISALPVIGVTIASFYILKDSPKLLLNKKKLDDAIETLQYLAHEKNQVVNFQISQEDIRALREEYEYNNNIDNFNESSNKLTFSFKSLFSQKFRVLIILSAGIFITTSMINITNMYSLPLMLYSKVENNKQDMTFQILFTQVVTIPAILLTALTCTVIGRKTTILIGFIFCLITSSFTSVFQEGLIVCSAFVNFFIIFSLCTVKIYVIEAFPTKLRDYALAFCFCIAKSGDALTPFLCNYTLVLYSYGPMVLTNLLCILGMISAALLPFDTKGTRIE